MESIGQNLKQQRNELELTIQDVADVTKINPKIISDIEDNVPISLAHQYILAYVNTIQKHYNRIKADKEFDYRTFTETNIISQPLPETKPLITKLTPEVIKERPKEYIVSPIDNDQFAESNAIYPESIEVATPFKEYPPLNQEHPLIKVLKRKKKEIITYFCLAIFIGSIISFVFIIDENTFNFVNDNTDENMADSSVSTEVEKNEWLKLFSNRDSLVISAVATDTAWMKIIIDGSSSQEMYLVPNRNYRWAAVEKIVFSASNIGNIDFWKNDTLLPKLGTKTQMINNIVVTHNGIGNVIPLSENNAVLSVPQLDSLLNIHLSQRTTKTDTFVTPTHQRQPAPRQRKQTPVTIIDFSSPTITKPPILEKQQSGEQNKNSTEQEEEN